MSSLDSLGLASWLEGFMVRCNFKVALAISDCITSDFMLLVCHMQTCQDITLTKLYRPFTSDCNRQLQIWTSSKTFAALKVH